MKIIRINPSSRAGLRRLEEQLDRIGEKHGYEPPLQIMPDPDWPFSPLTDPLEEDDDEDE